jgi:hypothetical protein
METPAHKPQSAKAHDEMFCPSCGERIKKDAVVCVKCGVPIGNALRAHHVHLPEEPKDKMVAVLLAVFLGFWTWVYTYKKDAWKFWLNLVLCLLTFGFWGFVAWPWAIVDAAVKPASYYQRFPN